MTQSKFIVKKKNIYLCIDLDSILYFENSLRKIIIHSTSQNSQYYYGNFKELLNVLSKKNNFVQTHRSFIVNVDHIASIDSDIITFNNFKDAFIPVSKTFLSQVISTITKHSCDTIIVS